MNNNRNIQRAQVQDPTVQARLDADRDLLRAHADVVAFVRPYQRGVEIINLDGYIGPNHRSLVMVVRVQSNAEAAGTRDGPARARIPVDPHLPLEMIQQLLELAQRMAKKN